MGPEGFFKQLRDNEDYQSLANGLQNKRAFQLVYGLSSTQISFLAAALLEGDQLPVLVLTQNSQAAKKRVDDFRTLVPSREVFLYPDLEPVPLGAIAQSREVMTQRLRALQEVSRAKSVVLVAPVDAVLRKLVPPQIFQGHCTFLQVGERIDLAALTRSLVDRGYERVDMVEGQGHFSLRGGILDIFPPTMDDPVRIEFFDDEVDSIRNFSVESQRSMANLREVLVIPAKEMILDENRLSEAIPAISREFTTQKAMLLKAGRKDAYKRLAEKMGEILEKLEARVVPDGIDSLFSFFYPDGVSLLEYFPKGSVMFIEEPAKQSDILQHRGRDHAEIHLSLLEQGLVLPAQLNNNLGFADAAKSQARFKRVAFSLLPKQTDDKPSNVVNLTAKTMHMFKGKTDLLLEEIKTLREKGFSVAIFASTEARGKKIVELLKDNGIFAPMYSGLPNALAPGEVVVACGILESGFEFTRIKMAVITDWEVFGQPKRTRVVRAQAQPGAKLSHFSDLRPGDYVVHVNHGIGKYLGVKQLEVAGIRKDYLLVQYAGEDKLYVPTDQIDLVQKFLGAEGTAPKLFKLGGQEWHRVKQKVKESVKDLAEDLIALYASRQKLPGFRFSPDTVWQKEFEDAFPFEETKDQLKAIEDIKEDMEASRPMDRLLCGDVGYGKTEVAIRAVFKAVMDNKQVAVLVPTTVLAQQHYNTFTERFTGYPINVQMLSRFKSAGEQKEILKRVEKGAVDVIIGTHRLLQKDVQFKDLGLVIVDEEQRFGVVHKESLKYLRQNVDVLTLTATPIPRTLHMALVGARDMSVLESPPEDRFPVQTYVLEFNLDIIADAIQREIDRGGQVYFVHNRVMDIEKTGKLLQAVVPEARFCIVHGQMKEDLLERRMLDFISGNYDVLICTTIIETGLDIANVNTLLLDEADRMGLSQLHQLRGRVGRSHRLAYAYFTYRKDKSLSEIAEKRLQAIRDFTEFGAGFKIAMRDMEIRGVGNILGPEQHGHMVAVGFDMYCRLLEEAVHELQGEAPQNFREPNLDLNLDAFIADIYVSDPAAKIEVYKKIMRVESKDDSMDMEEELIDRFGDIPQPVMNLLAIARIKSLAGKIGVQSIFHQKDTVNLKFFDTVDIKTLQLAAVTDHFRKRVTFAGTPELQIMLSVKGLKDYEILDNLELLLDKLTKQPE